MATCPTTKSYKALVGLAFLFSLNEEIKVLQRLYRALQSNSSYLKGKVKQHRLRRALKVIKYLSIYLVNGAKKSFKCYNFKE